jgi:hypothetical protein
MFASRISAGAVVAAVRPNAAFHRRWRTPVNTAESAVGTVFAGYGGGNRRAAGRFFGLTIEICGQGSVPLHFGRFCLLAVKSRQTHRKQPQCAPKGGIAAAP